MADTIITNSPDKNNSDSGAGWVVALVVIFAVVVGAVILYQRGAFRMTAPSTSSTNINITTPSPKPPTATTDVAPTQP